MGRRKPHPSARALAAAQPRPPPDPILSMTLEEIEATAGYRLLPRAKGHCVNMRILGIGDQSRPWSVLVAAMPGDEAQWHEVPYRSVVVSRMMASNVRVKLWVGLDAFVLRGRMKVRSSGTSDPGPASMRVSGVGEGEDEWRVELRIPANSPIVKSGKTCWCVVEAKGLRVSQTRGGNNYARFLPKLAHFNLEGEMALKMVKRYRVEGNWYAPRAADADEDEGGED